VYSHEKGILHGAFPFWIKALKELGSPTAKGMFCACRFEKFKTKMANRK